LNFFVLIASGPEQALLGRVYMLNLSHENTL